MFNKTDAADAKEKQQPALQPAIPPDKHNTSLVLASESSPLATRTSPLQVVSNGFKRMKIRTKATIMAIAISTIPVLALGVVANAIASRSITDKVTRIQASHTEELADKINRFMFERYGDIQVMASLPIFANRRIRDFGTQAEKQAILDKYVDIYKVYDNIAVFDLNGDVIAQSTPKPGEAAISNHRESDYFQKVLQDQKPLITQPRVSKTSGKNSIFVVAPIQDTTSGQLIGVIRARMPVTSVEILLKLHSQHDDHKEEYFLGDASGKIFVSSISNKVGREIKAEFPNLQTPATAESTTFTGKINNQEKLFSYASTPSDLPGLPSLQWAVLVANDAATAFEARNQLALATLFGTAIIAGAVGMIAYWLAKRATDPLLNATETVERIGRGDLSTRIQVQSDDELGDLGTNINQMAEQLQALIKKQEIDTERAKNLTDITLKMRRTLETEEILKTAVREIRQGLKTDRVIFYKFNPETWDGVVVAESVAAGFPKMTGVHIDDPCFRERHVETYKDGRIRAISNIYQDTSLQNATCYVQMLEKFAVKANLIAPIVTNEQLIGLLIAHHCDSPRVWQPADLEFFRQISTQMGFALEHGSLLEEIEQGRRMAEASSMSERQQKEALQMQLLELLSEVEGAASGDLTVRADVTTGEIGTVADFFNSIVESLRGIVTQVKQTATQVNASIADNSSAIDRLAIEALNQAEEINRTLDAVDNMTRSMQTVAMSAQKAAAVANEARNTATNSGTAMERTVKSILSMRETVGETAKKVKRLGESTQQISRVVALINQISMQTNLLAINAGIEAARAGEEAQGFVVVAEEVGELAARSAAATKEIEQIVENIQRETSEVVQAMEQGTSQVVEGTRVVEDAKQSLNQILDVSRQLDVLIQSISMATSSQLETSHQVSQLMEQIAAVSQHTSYSSRQVSESLQQTVEISRQLQDTVGTFKVD